MPYNRIDLPWPARELWPNRKAHWTVKSVKAAKAKADAMLLAKASVRDRISPTETLPVVIAFYAPTRRRYDLDGALSACKAAIDGIASAIGVDDSKFQYVLQRGDPIKGGMVRVVLHPGAEPIRVEGGF